MQSLKHFFASAVVYSQLKLLLTPCIRKPLLLVSSEFISLDIGIVTFETYTKKQLYHTSSYF